ncbi:MAG TPA: hypothetical protein PKE29_18925 [Phycisphaerales bacterium]|nr:hypothetical protein [Phycisphaerales bacterium]
MAKSDAARFERPFAHVEQHVLPERKKNRRETYAEKWWIHVEPRPALRAKMASMARVLVTPTLTKFRLFSWCMQPTLPDHQLIVFCRDDDYFFGALHSSVHDLWSLQQGTQLETRPRYTPSSTFETFPLPWLPGQEPSDQRAKHHTLWKAISQAAHSLNDDREALLNPPEAHSQAQRLVGIRYKHELEEAPAEDRPRLLYSAALSEATTNKDLDLSTGTLTNLYNERPAWLRLAHLKLDRAVLAAYKAVDPKGDWDPAWADAYEPFGAGEITIKEKGKGADKPEIIAAKKAAIAAREITDARILANLLRLNHERARVSKSPPPAKAPKPAREGSPARPPEKSRRAKA